MYIFVFRSVGGGDNGEKRAINVQCVCVCSCGKQTEAKTEAVREKVWEGKTEQRSKRKNDWGLKVLRLRVLGLRSEDIIVMFCFH